MKPSKKFMVTAALTSVLAFSAAAGADPIRSVSNDNHVAHRVAYNSVANRSQWHPARKLVAESYESVMTVIEKDRKAIRRNPGRVYDLLEKHILPHFDFRTISRLVLGLHWRRATPEQRDRFAEEFRIMLVNAYAKALVQYSGRDIEFLPVRAPAGATRVRVRTEIEDEFSSIPDSIVYDMALKNNEWKIYNMTVNSISVVHNYRNSYSRDINRLGGLDGLINKLRENNGRYRRNDNLRSYL